MNISPPLRVIVSIVLACLLAACGGGGSGGGANTTPTTAADVTAYAVTPSSAAPGGTVRISGAGLNKVTAVSIAGIDSAFQVVSDTVVAVTVPTSVSTASATVMLSGSGFSLQVPASLTLDLPTLSSVSASTIELGASVSVTGIHLDDVSRFSVGGTVLTASAVTSTSATLQTPATAIAGPIVLTDAMGNTYTTAYQLNSHAALSVASLSRSVAVVGDAVTLYGSGLNLATSVTFGNGASAPIVARSSSALTFTVPAQAGPATGATQPYVSTLTLTTAAQQVSSTASLSVGPSLSFGASSATSNGASSTVVVNGSNLLLVTGASVGNSIATIASATDSMLTLTVAGPANGNILLTTAYQSSAVAGSVSTSVWGDTTTLSEIDFSQVLNKAGSDVSLRLTPLRPVLVRAFLTSSRSGVASPAVSLQVSNGNAVVGTLAMTGPATIPSGASASALGTTYNVTVPAAWIVAGASFRVTSVGASTQTVSATPTIGAPAAMHIVLVPLTLAGVTGVLPSSAQVHDAFARSYPLASSAISVTTRAAYAVSGVSSIASNSDASAVLSQLEQLRSQEDPDAFYYGMFAYARDTALIAGIGFIGIKGYEAETPTSAIGYDAITTFAGVDPFNLGTPAWAQAMMHEVGHNHSLHHAPCGNAAAVDASYPYAGGLLGPQAVYNSLYADDISIGTLAAPVTGSGTMADMMGYCGGIFFSDYSYNIVQAFAEARTAAIAATPHGTSTTSASTGFLVISGSVGATGVTLNPAHATTLAAAPANASASGYQLRVVTAAGQRFTYPLRAHAIADADDGSAVFSHSLPNPGPVASIEVVRGGVVLADASATSRAMRAAADSGESGGVASSWSESGGTLHLHWNAALEPYVAVTHVGADGTRTVAAVQLQGGDADIDTRALSAGGRFELAFSSTKSARLTRVAR